MKKAQFIKGAAFLLLVCKAGLSPLYSQGNSYAEAHYDKNGEFNLPEAWVFETGTDCWKTYNSWPPENVDTKRLYLHERGVVSFDVPGRNESPFDEYISDPSRPVPYSAPFVSARQFYFREYMSENQRFASTRTDVPVYRGPVIRKEVRVAGPVEVELFVSTTGTDTDRVVKLIDVYPDTARAGGIEQQNTDAGGYQMLVRGDIFRGRFRESFEQPEPFVPGEVSRVSFSLPDVNHTFRKGHRLMVQVQSSWFPLFDRNPQTFTNIYLCGEDDFRKATHRVFHTPENTAHLTINVVQD